MDEATEYRTCVRQALDELRTLDAQVHAGVGGWWKHLTEDIRLLDDAVGAQPPAGNRCVEVEVTLPAPDSCCHAANGNTERHRNVAFGSEVVNIYYTFARELLGTAEPGKYEVRIRRLPRVVRPWLLKTGGLMCPDCERQQGRMPCTEEGPQQCTKCGVQFGEPRELPGEGEVRAVEGER